MSRRGARPRSADARHRERLVDLDGVLPDVRAVAAEPEVDRDMHARPSGRRPGGRLRPTRRLAAMFASTTSSNRARTAAALPAASSSSGGSSGRVPAGAQIASPVRTPGSGTRRWTSRRSAGRDDVAEVCRTVHSSAPGSASQSASDSGSERSVELPARDRHRLQCRDRRSEPPARTVAAAVGDRCDRRLERLVDAVDPVAHVDLVEVGRAATSSDARARIGDRQQVGDARPPGDHGRRATSGWSGTGGTVASSVRGSCIGQAYRPSASI